MLKSKLVFHNVRVICSHCEDELVATFHGKGMDSTVTYKCQRCGKTEVPSEEYHNFKEWEQKRCNAEEIKQLVNLMTDFVNHGGNKEDFAALMAKQHRTLQQSFTKLCFVWIEQLRIMQETGNYDGRNEAACRAGAVLSHCIKEEELYLPLV